jgi:NitT/TauT family transport system substrate-binding protein
MRSLDLADREGRLLVHFAEVNSRNGFFLLSRVPLPRFRWSELAGKTVISFAGAPTPWLCMLSVLRRHGVDPAQVTFVRDLHGPDAVNAFRTGRGDFLEQGQPATEELLAEGAAHLVASMGEATGPVPFSSYMTTPERLRSQPDVILRFTRAIQAAQRWIAKSDAAAVAQAVAPTFPEIPGEIRARAIDRYLRQGTWATDPILRRSGFESLQEILLAGGFIRRRHRYADLVNTDFAERVVRTPQDHP